MDYKIAKGVYHNDAERDVIVEVGKAAKGYPILNIGIEYGGSLVCLRHGGPKSKIFAMDLIGDDKLVNRIDNCEIIRGDSGELAKKWGERLGAIFIDGDHTTEGVLKDCTYIDFLMKGGIVAFHDCTGPAGEDVNLAVSLWYQSHAEEFKELKQVHSIRWFVRS